jgi:hypothetical protein
MTSFIQQGDILLGYIFDEEYVDLCHPNHPDCVTGTTCPDCDDGYNPHLIVACNLVVLSDSPIDGGGFVGIDENYYNLGSYILLYPNPTRDQLTLEFKGKADFGIAVVSVVDLTGTTITQFDWQGETTTISMATMPRGVYFVKIATENNLEVRKVMVQ